MSLGSTCCSILKKKQKQQQLQQTTQMTNGDGDSNENMIQHM